MKLNIRKRLKLSYNRHRVRVEPTVKISLFLDSMNQHYKFANQHNVNKNINKHFYGARQFNTELNIKINMQEDPRKH